MERRTDQVTPSPYSPKLAARPMFWPMVLLCRASDAHFQHLMRDSMEGSRRELHLFTVLNNHKYRVHGVRYDRRPNDRHDPLTPGVDPLPFEAFLDLPTQGTEGSIGGFPVVRCSTCSVWLIPGQECHGTVGPLMPDWEKVA